MSNPRLERYTGDFQLEGEDGVSFTVRWQFEPTKPSKNKNGITGWAQVDGKLTRVHVCFHSPCRADHKYVSKYGNLPVPKHGRVPGSASSAVAETQRSAVAESTATAAMVAPDNAKAAVAAPTPSGSAATGADTSEQALPAQTENPAAPSAPSILQTQPLPQEPSIPERPPLLIEGGSKPEIPAPTTAGAMPGNEGGLTLSCAPAPPPLPSPEVMEIPPPGRASVPPLFAADPVPPSVELEKPMVGPLAPFPAAVAAQSDDEEDVIVGDLTNENVAKEMACFVAELQSARRWLGPSAFLLLALLKRLRVRVWYGGACEDVLHTHAPCFPT